jgi:nucleotide-binding universal stress UspA family protein
MFRKIVVPLDGSQLALRPLEFLPRFQDPTQTEVSLVSVIQPWSYDFGASEGIPPIVVDDLRASWKAVLETQKSLLTQQGFAVSTHLREGDIAEEILNIADDADLIAMSTHGRSGLSHVALGSVAERVLHGSKKPLLLIRESMAVAAKSVQQLLVPLDSSPLAEQALPVAQSIAKARSADLTLLRVIQELDEVNSRILFKDKESERATLQEWHLHSSRYIEATAYRLVQAGVKVHSEVLFGDPAKTICTTARTLPADLIVMSTHGRSGLSRWFYGSVANKVMRSAPCPILLVRSLEGNNE